MKAVRFTLSGDFAFFKKPEHNMLGNRSEVGRITFNQIPKTAILGIFGSILGLSSFNGGNEYYEKLSDITVSIIPKNPHFLHTTHQYIDHTGMLYFDKGKSTRNLLFSEDVLVAPSWDIVLDDGNLKEDIADSLLRGRSMCHLYLGKNEFFAKIDNVKEISLEKVSKEETDEFETFSSIFVSNEELTEDDFKTSLSEHFFYKEFLPYGFDEKNEYFYKPHYFTDYDVKTDKIDDSKGIYETEDEEGLICAI